MTAILVFDVTTFRVQFPAFSDSTKYPDALLQGNWDEATCYISDSDYGYLNGNCRVRALNLMTAHITALGDLIAAQETPGLEQAATIDKISITLTPPPLKNQWQWWLSLTAYGQRLLALLQAKSIGGFYIGGLPERSAIRKVGGVF